MYCPPETVEKYASIQLGAAYQSLRHLWLVDVERTLDGVDLPVPPNVLLAAFG